ncbi:MAG: PD-(D/E)XK nuclease family protein [Planctomycetales bacterium]|nr:PD-(D/E)XK nuclease family protein [Planctomycetales bacterium]
MERVLENSFSWSKSRHRTFEECARKYWLHYYGSWGGWDRAAPAEAREAYLLKKVQSRQQWVGQEVHERIRFGLKMVQSGTTPNLTTQLDALVETMRRRFRESRAGMYVHNPSKILRLFEHEYAHPVLDEEWVRLREHAKDCLRGFYESAYFEAAKNLRPEQWLAVEDLTSFDFEGTPVWVALDFAFRREDGGVTIVDWKTGRSHTAEEKDAKEAEEDTLQLSSYALYAQHRFGVAADGIRLVVYALSRQHGDPVSVTEESLESARGKIRASMAAMRGRLSDPAANTARRDDFPQTEDLRLCRWCPFQRICWPQGVPEAAPAP